MVVSWGQGRCKKSREEARARGEEEGGRRREELEAGSQGKQTALAYRTASQVNADPSEFIVSRILSFCWAGLVPALSRALARAAHSFMWDSLSHWPCCQRRPPDGLSAGALREHTFCVFSRLFAAPESAILPIGVALVVMRERLVELKWGVFFWRWGLGNEHKLRIRGAGAFETKVKQS